MGLSHRFHRARALSSFLGRVASTAEVDAQAHPRGWLPRSWSWLWPDSGAVASMSALDGLRALAVGLVLLFHAWNQQPDFLVPGQWEERYPMYYTRSGVHLFFVLSGFLLFLPYARWLLGRGPRPSAAKFYKRRALRVAPAYFACLTLLTLMGPHTFAAAEDWLLHATFLFNVRPVSMFSIDGVFWTMAVEVQFYVALPVLAVIAYWISRRLGPLGATAALFMSLLAVSFASADVAKVVDPAGDRLIWTGLVGVRSVTYFLSVFGAGIACSVVYTYVTQVWSLGSVDTQRLTMIASGVFGAAAGVGVALVITSAISIPFGRNSLFGVVYAGLLFGILLGAPILRRPFELRAVRFLGLISYSVYLWHLVILTQVMSWLQHVGDSTDRVILGLIVEVAGVIPIAYASYLLSERPFIAARRQAH